MRRRRRGNHRHRSDRSGRAFKGVQRHCIQSARGARCPMVSDRWAWAEVTVSNKWAFANLISNRIWIAENWLLLEKIATGWEKNLRKFVRKEDIIWNNFCNWNFFWFSTDFELFERFQVNQNGFSLCKLMLIAIHFSNRPELNLRQGVIHSDL
jgi:hypothetical protein